MTARTIYRGQARDRRSAHGRRSGFTLLEMLAVITIIAILIAVAFPAYQAVIRRTRVARVKSEMASIGTAIATFKTQYNTEPPSYISFVAADAPSLPPQTKAILRRMFPQISFDAALTASLTQAGLLGEELKGVEALVFFLGGVRRDADGNAATPVTPNDTELIGFSKNPANPFVQSTSGQSGRIGPFFEFDSSRLFLKADDTNDPGTTPQLAYKDVLSSGDVPYIYASTAATGTYRDGTTAATTDFPPLAGGGFFKAYRKKSATGPFWNPNSYQLISPGPDGDPGDGGVYDPNGKPPVQSAAPPATSISAEDDNLANFADGPLGG